MQILSAFLDNASLYAYLFWLIPAALLLYFLGWFVRGTNIGSMVNNHKEALSERDLKFNNLVVQLEQKNQLIHDLKTERQQELEASPNDTIPNHSFDATASEEYRELRSTMQRKLDEQTIRLEHTQRRLKKYKSATKEYEDNFSALKTKYKQRDAKLYGEIVELRAYVFDLKASHLKVEKERNILRDSERDLVKRDSNTQSANEAIHKEIQGKGTEIAALHSEMEIKKQQYKKLEVQFDEKRQSLEELESKLQQKDQALEKLSSELDKRNGQHTAALESLQQNVQLEKNKAAKLDTEQKKLQLKYNDLKNESRREAQDLKSQILHLQPLSRVNKNQTRTIQTIETKLKEFGKQGEKYQQMAAELVIAQSELQKTNMQLKLTEKQHNDNTDELNFARDALQQSRFENRKLPSLQRQLLERDATLRKRDIELATLRRAQNLTHTESSTLNGAVQTGEISSQIAHKSGSQKNTAAESKKEIQQLKEQIKGQKHTIDQINKSLAGYRDKARKITETEKRLAVLESQLSTSKSIVQERNNEIATLKTQYSDASAQSGHEAKKVSALQQALLQSEKNSKSITTELNRLRLAMAKEAEAHSDGDKKVDLQQALEVAEENNRLLKGQLNELMANSIDYEKLKKEAAQISPLQVELEHANNRVKQLQAQLAPHKEAKQKQLDTEKKLEKRVKELSVFEQRLPQTQSELSRSKEHIANLEAQLAPLQTQAEVDSATIEKLQIRIEKLKPISKLLSDSQEKVAYLSSKIDQQLKDALEVQSLQQENMQLREHHNHYSELQAEILLEKKINAEYQVQKESLEKSLQKSRKEAEALLESTQSQTRKSDQLMQVHQKELSSLKHKLAEAQQSRRRSEDSATELKTQLEKANIAEQELTTLRDVATKQRDELNRLRAQLPQLEAKLSEQTDMAAKVQSQTREIAKRDQELSRIKLNAAKTQELENKIAKMSSQLKLIPELQQKLKLQNNLKENLKTLQNKISERDSKLSQASSELKRLPEIHKKLKLQSKLKDELASLQKKLHDRDGKLAEMSSELQQIPELKNKLEKKNRTVEEVSALQNKLNNRDSSIQKLTKKVNELPTLENKLTEQTRLNNSLKKLPQQLKERDVELSRISSELEAQKALVSDQLRRIETQGRQLSEKQQQLDKAKQQTEHYQKRMSALQQHGTDSASSTKPQHSAANANNPNAFQANEDSELIDLRKKVESLIVERDMGLNRVKELSESARLLAERDKQLKQLKLDAADDRIKARDLDSLRAKLERNEQEIQNKNFAIDELKKMLREQKKAKPKPAVSAKKTTIKKATTTKSNAKKTLFSTATNGSGTSNKDDLKKIHGIGPKLEQLLNDYGITHYQQIVELSVDDIRDLEENIISFSGRIERDDWIGGAKVEQQRKYGKVDS